MKFRKEKDSMGEIDVPEDKYYGDTVCHGSGLVKGILLTKRVGP
jgi:fumarate hydratase class II